MDEKQFRTLTNLLTRIALALESNVDGNPCIFCGKSAKNKINDAFICITCYGEKTREDLQAAVAKKEEDDV